MKKKIIIVSLVLFIFALVFNINNIYISIVQPMKLPYPPIKAYLEGNVVNLNGDIQNKEKIDKFIEEFNSGKQGSLVIQDYDTKIPVLSYFFITAPKSLHRLKSDGEKIEYRFSESDIIFLISHYSKIEKEIIDGYIIYSLKESLNQFPDKQILVIKNN